MENIYFKANFKPKKFEDFSCELSLIEDIDEFNNTIYVIKFFEEVEKEQFAFVVRRLAPLGGKWMRDYCGIVFRTNPFDVLGKIIEYQLME